MSEKSLLAFVLGGVFFCGMILLLPAFLFWIRGILAEVF